MYWALIELGIVLIKIFTIIATLPIFHFGVGLATGILVKAFFADLFIECASLINITLTPQQIPIFCAFIAFIGGFFQNGILNFSLERAEYEE